MSVISAKRNENSPHFKLLAGLLLSIRPRKSNTAGFADVTVSGVGFSTEGMQCNFNGTPSNLSLGLESENSATRVAGACSLLRCVPPLWGGANLPQYPSHGLVATYYSACNATDPVSAKFEPDVDFSAAYGLGAIGSLTSIELISIRWAGFFHLEIAETYTMYLAVSDIDERARLWVDNTLVVDMWVSLTGTQGSGTIGLWMAQEYYEIFVEYKQETGSMG